MAELEQDFHQQMAEHLCTQLKQGQAPWQRSWEPGESFMPINATTGRRYRSMNALHLIAQGYTDSRWLTANQAFTVDAQLQQGAMGTVIQFYKLTEEQTQRDAEGRELLDSNGQPLKKEIPLQQPRLLMATVFNAEQVEGELRTIRGESVQTFNNIVQTTNTLKDSRLILPDQDKFSTEHDYQAAVLRQWAHWTGDQHHLNRNAKHPFGSEGYAQEKLCVEIASMFLSHDLGLGYQPDQQAACVPLWIKMLEDDPQTILRIARDAEQICEYLLTLDPQQQTQDEPIYLNVPYAQREDAKELGAHWDAQQRLWYVDANADLKPFDQWRQMPTPSLDEVQDERQYLAVPFEERQLAKQAGALWDQAAKCWYVGPQGDTTQLQRWKSQDVVLPQPSLHDIKAEFSYFLKSRGCHVDGGHPHMDSQKHRISVDGDGRGQTSGYYIAHDDGRPAGYVMNYRTSQGTKWVSKGYELDSQQKAAYRAQAATSERERTQYQAEAREKVAQNISRILDTFSAIDEPTPYLLKKGISPQSGVFTDQQHKNTYIPATDVEGKVWTMQTINDQGDKRFALGSRKAGCFHVVGGFETLATVPTIVISEGYATAASVSQALGFSTVAAFDAGNLKPVAEALHRKYPYKPIIIAGDDDRHTELTQGYNTGKNKAQAAADAVGGKAIFPIFAAQEVPASPHITPLQCHQHKTATENLENPRAAALTQDQIKKLKAQQLTPDQLQILDTMKNYKDFNDLATKSTLSAEMIQNQIRTAMIDRQPSVYQSQQVEHQVQSQTQKPKKQSRSIHV